MRQRNILLYMIIDIAIISLLILLFTQVFSTTYYDKHGIMSGVFSSVYFNMKIVFKIVTWILFIAIIAYTIYLYRTKTKYGLFASKVKKMISLSVFTSITLLVTSIISMFNLSISHIAIISWAELLFIGIFLFYNILFIYNLYKI